MNFTDVNLFYMRFSNKTGSKVLVDLNCLFQHSTGDPKITSAYVENTIKSTIDVKMGDKSVYTFYVENGQSCFFSVTWEGGLFSLEGEQYNSYYEIIESAGYSLVGEYSIPNFFMAYLFAHSLNMKHEECVFDVKRLHPNRIGNYFMYNTWRYCTSLTKINIPDTSEWHINRIGNNFLDNTWYNCTSLVEAVILNTSNWRVEIIDDFFMTGTWSECISLKYPVVPDMLEWQLKQIPAYFLAGTWFNCESLVNPVVPCLSCCEIKYIADHFLFNTWKKCKSLRTALFIDTSKWYLTTEPKIFLEKTWDECTSLIKKPTVTFDVTVNTKIF
jgi:hypothetical protein